eukprot:g77479.t1
MIIMAARLRHESIGDIVVVGEPVKVSDKQIKEGKEQDKKTTDDQENKGSLFYWEVWGLLTLNLQTLSNRDFVNVRQNPPSVLSLKGVTKKWKGYCGALPSQSVEGFPVCKKIFSDGKFVHTVSKGPITDQSAMLKAPRRYKAIERLLRGY